MDQQSVAHYLEPETDSALPRWQAGDAWLGGGTHLFSRPHPQVRRLIDRIPSAGRTSW
jgi:hypothetical protein